MMQTDEKVRHTDTDRVGVVVRVLDTHHRSVHWQDGSGTTDEHVADLESWPRECSCCGARVLPIGVQPGSHTCGTCGALYRS